MSRRTQLLSIILATTMLGACERPSAPTDRAVDVATMVPTGGICGGPLPFQTCSASGDFCKKPTGVCETSGSYGVCTPRPTEVTYPNAPVCGCDGKTYGNQDYADAAGVNVRANGECPRPEPQGVAMPTIQIVPEVSAGGVSGYCRLADRPGGKDLIVRLRNPAPLNKPPMNMSVGFTPNTTVAAMTPAIPGQGTVDVRVPVPNTCFSPDCGFVIRVQDPAGGVQAQGSCIG
jgi:hypothetical protein